MKRNTLLFFLMHLSLVVFSQIPDSAQRVKPGYDSLQKASDEKMLVSGAVSATNNGISLIPTFSLGKPAVIFDLSLGKRFSFDPEFAFSLKGKPWYFLFWFRYKLVNSGRFRMSAGTHLGLNFVNTVLPINHDSTNVTLTERYVVAELVPTYSITKNISAGIYYLYSHGIDPTTVKNSHFITVNAGFSNIKLVNKVFMNVTPQFYYLNQGLHDGFYVTSAVTLTKSDLPFSISSVINKAIRSNIIGSKDFVWNITLTYSFGK